MFGDRLKELRKQKELTLQELADKLGMKNQTLSKYELNHREPPFATVKKIAEYFNVSLDFLFDHEVDKDPENLAQIKEELIHKISLMSDEEIKRMNDFADYLTYKRVHRK